MGVLDDIAEILTLNPPQPGQSLVIRMRGTVSHAVAAEAVHRVREALGLGEGTPVLPEDMSVEVAAGGE